MKLLGLDLGSAYFKGVVIEGREVLFKFYKKETGASEAVREFLQSLSQAFPDEKFRVGASGLAGAGFLRVNEIIGLASGALFLHPEVRSIIEIGAQTSKFVILKEGMVKEFSTNELCAAGTGSFIEQQAKRLHLTVEELSALSLKARRAARIAGRCSVFAKSDMIHLQQKGTPVEEIAYGLCMAIARNSWASLLKGRNFETPILIAGGCAKNKGIIRAFSKILRLKEGEQILASALPGMETAIGAALEAEKNQGPVLTTKEVEREVLRHIEGKRLSVFVSRKPLPKVEVLMKKEPQEVFTEPVEGYLGIDVGSVSTDFAVVDREGNVLSSVYLPTKGRPVEVILQGLSILKARFKAGLKVLGCGTTGSGRYLAAKLVGADVVKNEITCQIIGTRHFFEDVDTIFEIGGQDSKYISLKNGKIDDFTMNKICAAGTGSFLEEQSQQLGIDIYTEFAPLAFSSRRPVYLNSRCTVFMESEVASAIKRGVPVQDICAGLAYAIAENYLERVVEKRRIGNKISFQGGVASNRAVVAAFEALLGKKIMVHPYNRISGAIGAALAAKLYKKEAHSKFRGFEIKVESKIKTFECKACPNYCEVSLLRIGGEKVFFGDACERFSSKRDIHQEKGPSLAEFYINAYESYFTRENAEKGKIGIPRASSLIGFMPFWATFFKELGFAPVLSPHSNEEILLKGVRNLPVGACLPVKLTAGHVAWLLEKGLERVFIPAVVTLPGSHPPFSYGCPYTQSIPFMVKLSPENLISPVVKMDGEEEEFLRGFEKFQKILDSTKQELKIAYRKALQAQREFERRIREKGREEFSTQGLKFAVLGRPYNLYDAYLNLNLFTHLQSLSVPSFPMHFLPFPLEGEEKLPWRFASDIVKAVERLRDMEDVYPIIVSNFGCGPDAFAAKLIEDALENKPYLLLEFDEHRGEAGLITRLEAFLDRIKEGERRSYFYIPQKKFPSEIKDRIIYIPYFADHAYAFSGALKFAGYEAEVLPPPDESTRKIGEYYSSGKECHAYAELLGDLAKLAEKEKRPSVYFFPGTKIPCLLNQYGNGMRIFLKNKGIDHITVFTPFTEDFIAMVGMEGAERFYKGLLAIDILTKASCQVRPYEIKKGEADKIHREGLLQLEKAIASGDILETLDRVLQKLQALKSKEASPRPVVGVAGDMYTRANPYANNDLFHYLEERGLEVWPAPFEIDIIDFGIFRSFYQTLSRAEISGIIQSGLLILKRAVEVWKIRKKAWGKVGRIREPGYREALKLASPYVWNEDNEILVLNIAKILDFARGGADGIINAMCFGCMMGTASAAVIEKIKRDYDIPIITLVYSGAEHPGLLTALDAFVEQVKERASRRSSTSSPLSLPFLNRPI